MLMVSEDDFYYVHPTDCTLQFIVHPLIQCVVQHIVQVWMSLVLWYLVINKSAGSFKILTR